MVTVDSSRRFRFSNKISREAGFRPGQKLAVVATSGNTFQIVSSRKVAKNSDAIRYSVEKDGRIRVSERRLKALGVTRNSRKRSTVTFPVNVSRGSITVSI